MSSRLNHDSTFGHYFFKSAIDMAYLAEKQWRVPAGQASNPKEAKRLYGCALTDARAALQEIRKDRARAAECVAVIVFIEAIVSGWEDAMRALPD